MKINVSRMNFSFRGEFVDVTIYPTHKFALKLAIEKTLGWRPYKNYKPPVHIKHNALHETLRLRTYGTCFTLHRRQIKFLWDMMEDETDVKSWDVWFADGLIRQVMFDKFSIVVKDDRGKDVYYTIPWKEYMWVLEHFARKNPRHPTCTDGETTLSMRDLRVIKRRYRSRVKVDYQCDIELVDKEAAEHISHLVNIAHNSFYQDGNADNCLAVVHVAQDGWGNWWSKQSKPPYEKPSFGWSIILYAKSDEWDWGALQDGKTNVMSKDNKFWLPDKRVKPVLAHGAGFIMNGGIIWHGEEYSVHT